MPRRSHAAPPVFPIDIALKLDALGEQIVRARKLRKLSQRDLADMIGVSPNTVVAMERGDERVRIGSYALAIWTLEISGSFLGNFAIQYEEDRP